MGLQLSASGRGVHLSEAFFDAVRPLLDEHPRLARLGGEEFYGAPVVRDVQVLRAEVVAVRRGWRAWRREELAVERGVTARGAARERILDQLVADDPVLGALEELVAVCDAALEARVPITGVGD